MRRFIAGILLGALGVFAWNRLHPPVATIEKVAEAEYPGAEAVASTAAAADTRFSCDGRTRCSQMTSCEEAKFFLENCPGVKMDGEGDGIPCEGQWCGDH